MQQINKEEHSAKHAMLICPAVLGTYFSSVRYSKFRTMAFCSRYSEAASVEPVLLRQTFKRHLIFTVLTQETICQPPIVPLSPPPGVFVTDSSSETMEL